MTSSMDGKDQMYVRGTLDASTEQQVYLVPPLVLPLYLSAHQVS